MHLFQMEGKKGLLCLLHPTDSGNQHPLELDCFFGSDFVLMPSETQLSHQHFQE